MAAGEQKKKRATSKAYESGQIRREDWLAIGVLTFLYFLQGLPMGLVQGTLPLLLKAGGSSGGSGSSFTQLGLFSTVLYPYSLKLLWSPVVDSIWSQRLGRRKSWIVPTQILAGLGLLLAGTVLELDTTAAAAGSDASEPADSTSLSSWLSVSFAGPMTTEQQWSAMAKLTGLFFVIVLLVATQDIALDGWALTMLPRRIVSYGSTCQTVGLQVGGFVSYTLLLALHSPAFCNALLRSTPDPHHGLVTVNGFLLAVGWLFLAASALLVLFPIAEPPPRSRVPGTAKTYWYIASVLAKPGVRRLCAVLLLCKLGFVVTDTVTNLKFFEAGLSVEYLGLIAALDFPCQIVSAVWIGWMSAATTTVTLPSSHSNASLAASNSGGLPQQTPPPAATPPASEGFNNSLSSWCFGYLLRLLVGVFGTALVLLFQSGAAANQALLFGAALLFQLLNSFASTAMFVSIGAFFARICDRNTGGTFITLLQTASNLGGMWPKFLVLALVDLLTASACVDGPPSLHSAVLFDGCHVREHPSASLCVPELNRHCLTTRDGYFATAAVSFAFAAVLYFGYLRAQLAELSALSTHPDAWQPTAASEPLSVDV